jgi:glycosyltransferase involved in cell wall biosynthesis
MSEIQKDLSVVIPLFNEEESLPELFEWISRVVLHHQLDTEVIFIDDGSSDNSWQVIQELEQKGITIKAVQFQRNYGKSAAMHTGFEAATGKVVITMDADMQDSPDEIKDLYQNPQP